MGEVYPGRSPHLVHIVDIFGYGIPWPHIPPPPAIQEGRPGLV